MFRTRLLALFLDVLVCAAPADVAGLGATWVIWRFFPASRALLPGIWGILAAFATSAFLLRDSKGGRARRWLALEVRRADGLPPGAWGSIRRNLPLLVPVWNLYDAWPLLSDGEAPRRCDRAAGMRISRIT